MKTKKIISLRDDDINKFTNPERLKAWYEPIFDKIKPTLCVTPYAGEIYRRVRDSENLLQTRLEKINYVRTLYEQKSIEEIRYPIYENKALVDLLKKWCMEGKIEIALHGITHNQTPYGFECEGEPPSFEKLSGILRELENTFCVKVKWFSPPNNSIKKPWMKMLKRTGLNLVHSLGPKPWETQINVPALISLSRVATDVLLNGRNSRINKPLSLGEISFLQSIPLSPGMRAKDILVNFDSADRAGKSLVIATHSYAFDYAPELYSDLILLLDYARELGFSADTLEAQLE